MAVSEPCFSSEAPAGADARRHAPATARNRDAILAVLRRHLPGKGRLLEVASGSGEHALFFARALPHIDWQPSDAEQSALGSIEAWRVLEGEGLANLRTPVRLDLMRDCWPEGPFDALFVANLTHIAPFAATEALFAGAREALHVGAPLLLYGPFFRDDALPSEGDLSFDASLRARDPALGLRSVHDIDAAARACGFTRSAAHPMPANNLTLAYSRGGGATG